MYATGNYAGWSPDGLHRTEHPEPVCTPADGLGDTSNFMIDPVRGVLAAFGIHVTDHHVGACTREHARDSHGSAGDEGYSTRE